MGIDTTVIPLNASAVKADILATVGSDINLLGEIRQFALSITGALTKSQLQAKGWAICDGTTATAQGISDATIENTPNLRSRFLRGSANETTGGTGGSATKDLSHLHQTFTTAGSGYPISQNSGATGTDGYYDSNGTVQNMGNSGYLTANTYSAKAGSTTQDILPPYYDICYFIKVKV